MKVLHVDASARHADSVSRALSARFVEALKRADPSVRVERLDLAVSPPRHVSAAQTEAMYVPEAQRTPTMHDALRESEHLCGLVLEADTIVCGMPMYNFGMPSVFKAFVDNIVRVGRTFVQTESGFEGFLKGRRALFVTSRGADYSPGSQMAEMDLLEPHLRMVFGFMGIEQMEFVNPQPMQFAGPEAREAGLDGAGTRLDELADRWTA